MNPTATRRRVAGMTLIELMVALAIGSFLMIGAVTVFMQSRTTFRVTESVSRLQENARFALDRMEPDIRMASYWGLTTRPTKVQGRADAGSLPAMFAVAGDCLSNWSVDLEVPVGGSNNVFPAVNCNSAFSAAPMGGADTLEIRRVAEDPDPVLDAGTLYVQSARFQDSQIFVGPAIPAGYLPATSQSHRLIANGYYVSQLSSLLDPNGNNIPSLRVKRLTTVAGAATVVDEEILAGVEDMQIQYGVDIDAPGTPNRGSVDRFVNAGDPLLDPVANPDNEILAVRIWLRIRAERPENGFADTTNYAYADRVTPAPGDAFRRTVVSKTIYLRNARPPS